MKAVYNFVLACTSPGFHLAFAITLIRRVHLKKTVAFTIKKRTFRDFTEGACNLSRVLVKDGKFRQLFKCWWVISLFRIYKMFINPQNAAVPFVTFLEYFLSFHFVFLCVCGLKLRYRLTNPAPFVFSCINQQALDYIKLAVFSHVYWRCENAWIATLNMTIDAAELNFLFQTDWLNVLVLKWCIFSKAKKNAEGK